MSKTKRLIKPRNNTYKKVHKCLDCKRKVHNTVDRCTTCFLKQKARKYLGNPNNWGILKKIYDHQKGKCPYTGIKIVLGLNCTVDHIIPKANGGKNVANNIQFVYAPVNSMKGSLNEEEFLHLIKKIYHHRIKND